MRSAAGSSPPRFVVFGAGGLLGTALQHVVAARGLQDRVQFLTRRQADITQTEQVVIALDGFEPRWVINCAAFSNVDQAEMVASEAHSVNGAAVERLAHACKRRGIGLLHVSTDYVFDGTSSQPINEDARPNPVNAYGRSKLDGEEAVQFVGRAASGDPAPWPWIIFRTSWLFSPWGANFFSSIPRLLREGATVRVADDQTNRPTYAPDAAAVMLDLVARNHRGIIHFSNDGSATPLDLAEAWRTALHECVHPQARIERCSTASFGPRAIRPVTNLLGLERISGMLGHRPRHWWSGVEETARAMLASKTP